MATKDEQQYQLHRYLIPGTPKQKTKCLCLYKEKFLQGMQNDDVAFSFFNDLLQVTPCSLRQTLTAVSQIDLLYHYRVMANLF